MGTLIKSSECLSKWKCTTYKGRNQLLYPDPGCYPGGQISVFNSSNQIISFPVNPAPVTDANGTGFVFYDCNSSPAVVLVVIGTTACFPAISSAIGLPIKVKSFTAQSQNDNSVLLRWTSVFEANSSKYIVQRSADGRNFTDISEVKAAGNSVNAINYSYADRQMANGSAYYRLKLVDIDGSFDYTKIIYINNGQAGLVPLSVFPNPFRSEVQLKGVASLMLTAKTSEYITQWVVRSTIGLSVATLL
jgi:hypothetical protein